jgi:RNA polymerase sigma-70 factor (ECF subfamily)
MDCVMMVGSMRKITENDELATVQTPNPAGTDALELLYDGYYDRIYAYCVHRLFCRTTAEDVTGQIFLSAAKNFGAVSGQEFEIHVRWLYGIATNQCNSYIRRHLRRRKIFEKFQAETNHYQKDVDVPPDWTSVYAAIAELKEIEQTVITLRFFEDMSHEEIAAIIKKRQNSVRVILHRGLKKLQKLLNAAECGFIDRGVGHERL